MVKKLYLCPCCMGKGKVTDEEITKFIKQQKEG